MYSPTLTRFLQPDPIGFAGDPTNLYRYCGGDPVNNVDPNGLDAITVLKKPYEPKGPSFSVGSNYTPTGSHIPQSRTATWNGSAWDISYRDAVNGTQSTGSFALIGGLGGGNESGGEGTGAQFVRVLTPADLLRGFYGNFGEKLAAAIAKVFGTDASKIAPQTIANAPIVILNLTPQQLGQLANLGGPIWGWNNPTFNDTMPNGTIYVASGLSRMNSFRTYGHELGNLLDARLNGSETTYGRQDIGHNDTGGALEVELFGMPPGGF